MGVLNEKRCKSGLLVVLVSYTFWLRDVAGFVAASFSVRPEGPPNTFLTILRSGFYLYFFLYFYATKKYKTVISMFFLMQSWCFFLIRPLCGQSQLFFLRINGPINWKRTKIKMSFLDLQGVCSLVFLQYWILKWTFRK